MTAREFKGDDRQYLRWLRQNATGFVVTTTKNPAPRYMSLHRASCGRISQYHKPATEGAFTERAYMKACAGEIEELFSWVRQQGGTKFTTICTACNPMAKGIGQALAHKPVTEELPEASRWEGTPVTVVLNRYERSTVARQACIYRHGSRCHACGLDFGETYGPEFAGFIHVHHVVPQSTIRRAYKIDPVKDLVPVCPNCHAALHLGGSVRTVEQLRLLIKQQRARQRERR